MKVKSLALLCIGVFGCSNSFAWGPVGHEAVALVGSELALGKGQAFWDSNSEAMRLLTNVPDRVWKKPATKPDEAPTHWFQIDTYVPDLNPLQIFKFPKQYTAAVAEHTESVVIENGSAPWRIIQFYADSVAALKAGDMKKGLEMAGVMSHYIGDLAQPLHVTANHDGELTGNSGIHAWFETKNLGKIETVRPAVLKASKELLQNAEFKKQLQGDLMDVVLKAVARSVAKRDQILENDTKLGRSSDEAKKVQLELAISRMADGAATLSEVLNRIWRDSGLNPQTNIIVPKDPAWVPLDFSAQIPNFDRARPVHFVR